MSHHTDHVEVWVTFHNYTGCSYHHETLTLQSPYGSFARQNCSPCGAHWSRSWVFYIYKVQPKRCNFSQFYLFLQTRYMFQAIPPPIVRSTKLYVQRQVFVRPILEEKEELELIISISSTIVAGRSIGLTNTWKFMYSYVLLMMGGGTVWNM